ncbi:type II CRISPR RNA-guided endonuclease Cas9 [Capnocytophaga leadbetteri]
MKRILGLDLGSNSIGWALVQQNFKNKQGQIMAAGSRIIPMDQSILGDFEKGNAVSQTAERTAYRSTRRLRERHLLRRERLHRVLGFLPPHYDSQIDFSKRYGKFIDDAEPKIAYNKGNFIFMDSFNEMIEDFKKHQPQLFYKKSNGEESKIPYDWTIYYLRKKALSQKITQQELAWFILHFNQKRGYYQLRGEEETEGNDMEIISSKVLSVIKKDKDKKYDKYWYDITLENGLVYKAAFYNDLVYSWIDQKREFVVKRALLENGDEKIELSYLPTFDEIAKMDKKQQDKFYQKIKVKTESNIGNKTVSAYIYDHLLQNPNQKIKGKLVRTIERKYYKDELKAILAKQIALQPEFFTENLLADCIRELYRKNQTQQQTLLSKDFLHLFVEDIIFYQRPLRSQKSTIANCALEKRSYIDKETNERKDVPIKVCAKSNPYYQEFRVLQWLQNLRIYEIETDLEVTSEFIETAEDYEALFNFLMSQKEIDNEGLLKYFLLAKNPQIKDKAAKSELKKWLTIYRWNYVYDRADNSSKKYPMNETGYDLQRYLQKVEGLPANFLTFDITYQLWHLLYSVKDKVEFEKALKKFANKNQLDETSFVESFKNFKPYPNEYGSFSEKAIKKLLPLMRFGNHWDFSCIDVSTQKRIDDLINGVANDEIRTIIREKAEKFQLNNEISFQGLPLWLAQYIVYNRHAEATNIEKWTSVSDLEAYLEDFKQHSLRNPIVEQVVTETLRVVRDIWQQYGGGQANFFDEIHIELGRELKNTSKERERLSKQNQENENTNLRIKKLLAELKEDASIQNVRSYSPVQHDLLKIYEEGVFSSTDEIDEDIQKIRKKAEPNKTELQRYKLWLEQKYRSPYTGEVISLTKLFTEEYEIEHIIPQSRYYDDSLSNKVICESAVNKLKTNQLGLEFIQNHHGEKVRIAGNKEVTIFTEEQYKEFVKKHYAGNSAKQQKLFLNEIPEKMVARQMNDTRYISKYISEILSRIVRSDEKDEGVNSKNVIPCTGKITTALKQDWGLNDIWNELILPRFERMNQLTQTQLFTSYNDRLQKNLPTVPIKYSQGFQKKRIDHRHHAMDALVIACATREHINYMNNQHALDKSKDKKEKQQSRIDLRTILCEKKNNNWQFKKPWNTFTQESKEALEHIVVSFKQNLRVINKATNYYEKWEEKNGVLVKKKVKQEGTNWAIRKPLHKETVSGKIVLDRKIGKDKILTATRKAVDITFTEKIISSITDTGIQKILLNYLKYKGSPEVAFSAEGLEELNKNIAQYNDGKKHQPIYKVRIFEEGSKFPLGETGAKTTKYVEAAKGTNLFFGVYQGKGKRTYATIPLNEVIERQKQGLPSVPERNEKGEPLLFSLSPNDLVYVPMEGEATETIDFGNLSKEQKERIYKTVSFTGNQCFFVQEAVAFPIVNKMEYSPLNKMERDILGIMIKEVCIKLKVDRLGNITKA